MSKQNFYKFVKIFHFDPNPGLCNLRLLNIHAQINKLTPNDVHKLSPLVPY